MTRKIGIISDTHGLLREEVISELKDCDYIFHGGDINKQSIIDSLEKLAPLSVVRGNNDKEWAKDLPMYIEKSLYGFNFYITHKKSDISNELSGFDFVIYGHSHKYEVCEEGDVAYINPGSCGPRRFLQPITFAILELNEEDHTYEIRKIDLSPSLTKENAASLSISEKDLDKIVTQIIKDMDAGRNIDQIAKKNRVEVDLVESICRMYSTHPGVTVGGIIDKLELRKIYRK